MLSHALRKFLFAWLIKTPTQRPVAPKSCSFINLGDVMKGQDDDMILRRLRAEKVYLTSGATSAAEEQGWFRIVMAHPRVVLDEGLKRILHVINTA